MKRKWPARMPVRQLPEPAPATGELIKVRRPSFLPLGVRAINQLRVGADCMNPFRCVIEKARSGDSACQRARPDQLTAWA